MGHAKYIRESKERISEEFINNTTLCFGNNLAFAFIFGGLAKGYATSLDHDIDMFVCLKKRNSVQEEEFKKFYFDIHKKYGFTADHKDPVEYSTYEELRSALSHLDGLQIKREMYTYRDYESVVWGDIFSGHTIANTGDLILLSRIKDGCSHYPENWRQNILEFLTDQEILREGEEFLIKKLIVRDLVRLSDSNEIENDGGEENMMNKSLNLLSQQLSSKDGLDIDSIRKNAKDGKNEDDIYKIGLKHIKDKPVTLLFERYVDYKQKSIPSIQDQGTALSF